MLSKLVKFTAVALAIALATAVFWVLNTGLRAPESVDDSMCEDLVLRQMAKWQLIEEVAAERRTLWETAALFGALNRLPPPLPHLSGVIVVDDETLCLWVIHWLELAEPPASAETVARLKAELWQALKRPSGPQLPAVSPDQVNDLLAAARNRRDELRQRAIVP